MSLEGKIGSVGHYKADLKDDGTADVELGIDFAKPEWNATAKGNVKLNFDPIGLIATKVLTEENKGKWYGKAVLFLLSRVRPQALALNDAAPGTVQG